MPLSPEQKQRRIELLKRKRDLLMSASAEKVPSSPLSSFGRFIQSELPELAQETPLIPKIPEPTGEETPTQVGIRRALGVARDTASQFLVPGAGAGKQVMERPALFGRLAALGRPETRVPELVGLGARLAVQRVTPEEIKQPVGLGTEIAAGLGTGIIRGGIRRLGELRKTARTVTPAKEALSDISENIDDLKRLRTEKITDVRVRATDLRDKLQSGIDNAKEALKSRLPVLSGEAAEDMQGKLRTFFREGSKAYGDRLDEMVGAVPKSKKAQVTRGTVADIIRGSIDEAESALIREGRGRDILDSLLEKYRTTATQDPTTGKLLSLGRTVDLKDVITDLKNAKKALTAGVRSGAQRFGSEDIPIEILRKNLGSFVNEITGGKMSELNNTYKEFIDLLKTSNRVFKPFKGALESGQGAGLLTRVATGSAKKSEVDLLNRLETGIRGFVKGTGRVDDKLQDFVQKSNKTINTLTSRKKSITPKQKAQIIQIKNAIAQSIQDNQTTLEEVRQVLQDSEKAGQLLRRLGIGALATATVGIPVLRKIFSRGNLGQAFGE